MVPKVKAPLLRTMEEKDVNWHCFVEHKILFYAQTSPRFHTNTASLMIPQIHKSGSDATNQSILKYFDVAFDCIFD